MLLSFCSFCPNELGQVVPLLGHAAAAADDDDARDGVQGRRQRKTSRLVEFRGYRIPHGTPVYLNIYAVLRDEKVWPNPDNFDPEHFYDPATGKLVNLEKNLAFSVGEQPN